MLEINLNKNWQFRRADEKKWLPAAVPGCVHTDLLAAGKIPDPFYRTSERDLQWIDKQDWIYQTTFDIDEQIFEKQNIRLIFSGLDTYADVFLNGKPLFQADNMFRSWKVDCKEILQLTGNTLTVHFKSPLHFDLPKLEALGYQLPAAADQSEPGGMGDKKVSIFARKAPYHYGWDWGPRFVTSGIWRPVSLHAWDTALIENVHILQNAMTVESADLESILEITAAADHEVRIIISDDRDKRKLTERPLQLRAGRHEYTIPFKITNPEFWWPNGMGEPFLYTLRISLSGRESLIDEKTCQTGLRTINVIREKDERGRSFYFEINGRPVFIKGANYIPNDSFPSRVTPEKYQHIIRSAKDANMNMLRVWGGGIYENDIFYDLCDQHGILVWQDFMFACAMYPGDEDFIENVRQEAIDNVKRLRNHPCLAIWCGNNEMDWIWGHGTDKGWERELPLKDQTKAKIWQDYEKIFHRLLPDVLSKYDGQRFYWPSSPLADFGVRSSYESTSGNMHYWGVWHGKELFGQFQEKIGRFMTEYGFQSFPEFESVKQYTQPEDWNIDSEVMNAHQRSAIGNQRIRWYMQHYYKVPDNFQDMLYVGQVLQAEAIKLAIEAHRRRRPFCMGSLYWQINDCWPVASWSGIDYYGHWKALHYFAKKAYRKLLVSPVAEESRIKICIVSDHFEPIASQLNILLSDFYGEVFYEQNMTVQIEPDSSQVYFEIDKAPLFEKAAPENCYLYISLDADQTDNLFYFLSPKDLHLPKSQPQVTVRETDYGYDVHLTSSVLAKNVYLYIESENDGFFSDNYFDLRPGALVEIKYYCDKPIDDFKAKLKIKTLVDSVPG